VTCPRVILVTDPAFGDESIVRTIQAVAAALPPGWFCVQLRDKHRPTVSLRVFASWLRVVTRAVGAMLVVNGNARLARDVGADGVHLGRDAGTVAEARAAYGGRAWVSVAAHSNDAVRRGVGDGADAVLVSPVFLTRPPSPLAPLGLGFGHGDGHGRGRGRGRATEKAGRGLDALRSARILAGKRCAVYALGGVGPENAHACAEAGADGVALIRALLASAEPGRVARAIHRAIALC
jgi:thiamine-phosphate pyrophosphorylase